MRAHPQSSETMIETAPGTLFFRSLRRDWLSWSRMERATAIGILLSTPASVACALGAGLAA